MQVILTMQTADFAPIVYSETHDTPHCLNHSLTVYDTEQEYVYILYRELYSINVYRNTVCYQKNLAVAATFIDE